MIEFVVGVTGLSIVIMLGHIALRLGRIAVALETIAAEERGR